MEFKGTKGEWSINEYKSHYKFETEIICGKIRIAQAKHYKTEDGGVFYNDPTAEEGKANAQLIASAPKLLEALQTMVDLFNPTIDSPMEQDQEDAIEKSKQAIKQALG